MPNVIINEKDLSVFNIYLDNDNIVWIPGFSITGPYEAPRLLNSHSDLVANFGDRAPAENYASSATADTYKVCTGWDFAAQMLRKGFRVLFQRIVPYKYDYVNKKLTYEIDDKKLVNASLDLIENVVSTTDTWAAVPAGTEYSTIVPYYTVSGDKTSVYDGYYIYHDGEHSGEFIVTDTYYTKLDNAYILYDGYFRTSDETVVPLKTYYTYDSATEEYTAVDEPSGDPSAQEWFEQGFANNVAYYKYGFDPDVTYYTCTTETSETVKNKIGFKEKSGGTFGNRLAVIFTVNVNINKLFYKLVDTRTLEVLEYVEIGEVKYSESTGIDAKYLLTFARGLCEAIGTSKYVEFEIDDKYLYDVTSFNAYIFETLESTTGTFEDCSAEDGTIHYTRNPELDPSVPDDISIKDGTNYLINELLVNPKYGDFTLTNKAVRSTLELGNAEITTGNGKPIVFPVDEDSNCKTSAVYGKDFTVNDALDASVDTDSLKIFADTLERDLANISDKILYDVKYITLGNIYSTSALITHEDRHIYNVAADLCALRGDCVAILNPDYRKDSLEVKEDFKTIGGKPSSYASVFAPWAVMAIYNSEKQWCSPAMVFLTALAESVANGNPVYLPPAGVNRATLTDVTKTEYMIGSTLLDTWQNKDLPVNINPIMFLNTYGYVIFGQRTLYDVSDELVGTRSCLQELGVRLTVLECKKEIRRVALGLLFEYNNIHTWNEFKAGLNPMFTEMINNGALNEYQIIMDDTTNSPDDIDNNTLRGTIKIIPGRAVEDVIISFELYRNGVTFIDKEPNN